MGSLELYISVHEAKKLLLAAPHTLENLRNNQPLPLVLILEIHAVCITRVLLCCGICFFIFYMFTMYNNR